MSSAARDSARTLTHDHGHGPVVVAHQWTSPLGTTQVVEVEPLPGCSGREAAQALA